MAGMDPNPNRVLLAEDEPLAALVLEEVLTDMGHEVMLAGDGQAALELAAQRPFDVLVTDLAMPRLPGWELIPRLRASRPELPVVVMTGYLAPGMAERLRQTDGPGPLALLLKPFDIGVLGRVLDGMLSPAVPAGDEAGTSPPAPTPVLPATMATMAALAAD